MSQTVQPRHRNGQWAETVKSDPGASILDGIDAHVADRILADAVQSVRGGDRAVFASVLQTLARGGEYGPNITVDEEPGCVRIQIVGSDGRGRYDLSVPTVPNGGQGIEALRAYNDEAAGLLEQVRPMAVAMAGVNSGPPVPPVVPADADEHGNPKKIRWGEDTFTRCDEPGAAPATAYGFMIRTPQPMSDDQMARLAQLAGYAWAASVHGESLPRPERVDERTLYLFADSTKGRGLLDDFVDLLPEMVHDGSPIRRSDRAGEGTKGTRLVDGLPDLGGYSLYFED